jgi:hypothetical protein
MLDTLLRLLETLTVKLRGWSGSAMTEDKPPVEEKKAEKPAAPIDHYDPAVDRIRATSDGIVKALAAIGVILIVGIQFSSVGKLEWSGWNFDNRLLWALIAVLLGFIGIAIALLASVSVDRAGDVSLNGLVLAEKSNAKASDDDRAIYKLLSLNSSWKAGHGTFADIEARFDEAVRQRLIYVDSANHLQEISGESAERVRKKRAYYEALVIWYGSEVIRPILAFARYQSVRMAFSRSRFQMLGAAIMVGIAIGLFAWATNEPKKETPAPQAFVMPVSAHALIPSDEERARIRGIVGEGCISIETESIQVIMIAITDDDATVISVPSEGCAPKQFTLPRDRVIPAEPVS